MAVLGLSAAACGDDSDGAAGATSDEEFCQLVMNLEPADDDPEGFAALGALANRAPNAEVRSALERFAAVAVIDDDEEAFEVAFSPDFQAAFTTFSDYVDANCDVGDLGDGDTDETPGSDRDVTAEELIDAVTTAVSTIDPEALVGGNIVFGEGLILVSAEQPPAVILEICEVAADAADALFGDDTALIEVNDFLDGGAERQPGGACVLLDGTGEIGSGGDIDPGELSDAIRAVVGPDLGLSVVTGDPRGPAIGLDGDDEFDDPIAVCEDVASAADDFVGNDSASIEVADPRGPVAERQPGGSCQAV